MHTFKKGDAVQMLFDQGGGGKGAGGVTLLYGEVIAAGPMTYRVRWESGLSNRLRQGDKRVKAKTH